MKADAVISADLDHCAAQAHDLEGLGFAGVKSIETAHDPFLPLLLAAQRTQSVDLITGIAVAFARSPMIMANLGHDLNAAARGRFVLGLGSQIRPHITRRFSMPWSAPAARMREFVLAMRAIWNCWYHGEALNFTGEFYTHTLMTPFFAPTNTEYGPPRVHLAAVGPLMTEIAGEVADGLLVHGFTTEAYLRGVTLPALDRGLARSGQSRADVEISYPVFTVTGRDERELQQAAIKMREQIAFYGSTPAYKPVLDSIGAGELQPQLNALSKQGRWQAMGELIDDSVLAQFAVSGGPGEVAKEIRQRYGDIIDRTAAAYAELDSAQNVEFLQALSA